MTLRADEIALGRALIERGLAPEALRRCASEVEALRARGQETDLAATVARHALVPPQLLAQLLPRTAAAPRSGSGPRPEKSEDEALVGRTIGPYLIERLLGKGGMGVVYAALDQGLGRRVALKVLAAKGRSKTAIERFRREAKALASLAHPNVVNAHAFGEQVERSELGVRRSGQDIDMLWLAMDLVEGGSLEGLVGAKRPPRDVAVLLAKVAYALDAAHHKGLVHRDVKPANVLLDAQGEPRLADFGLALALDGEEERVTQPGLIVGTLAYLSPEQALSRPATPLSDVYALGVTLHELLAGSLPFSADDRLQLLARIVSEDPPPLEDVPLDLAVICRKALEKEPADRYPTADAMGRDLEAFALGRPISARPISAFGRVARSARRRPKTAAALVVASVALVSSPFVAWKWVKDRDEEAKRRAAEAAKEAAEKPFRDALAKARDLERAASSGSGKERTKRLLEAFYAWDDCGHMRSEEREVLAGTGRVQAALGMFAQAEPMLERALAAGASDAPTWAALARTIALRINVLGGDQGAEKAREAAAKASALDPAFKASQTRVDAGLGRDPVVEPGGAGDVLADRTLARALRAFREQRPEDAARLAASVAGAPEAEALAALILAQSGEPEQGSKRLMDIVADQPDNGSLKVILAQVFADALELELAFRALDGANVAAGRAVHPQLRKRLARAKGDDLDLDGPRALLDRAWWIIERGDTHEAARALQHAEDALRALQGQNGLRGIFPGEVELVLGTAYMVNQRFEEARDCAAKGLVTAPRFRRLLRLRLQLPFVERRFGRRVVQSNAELEQSLVDADEVLAHSPDDMNVHQWKSGILSELGRDEEALAACDAYVRARPPGDVGPARWKFAMLSHLGRWQQALDVAAAYPSWEQDTAFRGAILQARRLVPAPLAEKIAVASSEDMGDAGRNVWGFPPERQKTGIVNVEPEHDPRRVLVGRQAVRICMKGTSWMRLLYRDPGPFDFSKGELVLYACTEQAFAAAPLEKPVALVVGVMDEKDRAVVLKGSVLSSPGWKRIVVPLRGGAGWEGKSDPELALDRIIGLSLGLEDVPEGGAYVWIDGVGSR